MGLLSRKYKPVPVLLHWPSVRSIPLPDMQVFRKHAERVQMTNDIVLPEAQTTQVREFSKELVFGLYGYFSERLPAMSQDESEGFLGSLGMSACLGLGYSSVDNGLGMKHGYTEQCTLVAVRMGSSFLGDLPPAWQEPLFYSLQAGHFLGRKGRSSIPSLINGGYS